VTVRYVGQRFFVSELTCWDAQPFKV